LETQLIISSELKYQKDKSLLDELNEIRKMLFDLIKSKKYESTYPWSPVTLHLLPVTEK